MEKHFCANEALILNAIWQIAIFENRANLGVFPLFDHKNLPKPKKLHPNKYRHIKEQPSM